jgi:hypothetical protein
MTNEPRHLNRAPIVEAMIAFDFVTSSGGLDELKDSFFKQIEPEYPTQVLIQRAEVKFDANGSTGNTSTVGKRSLSADGKNVCAISENTFLCS